MPEGAALLLDPGGLEGAGPVGEVLNPHHRSVTERGDLVVHLRVELGPAPPASSVKAKPDRHEVTGIHEFLRLEPQLLERLVKPLPETLDLLRASARVRPLERGKHPFDLGVEEPDGGVKVAPVVVGDEVTGLDDVLLGHGPRSIPR